MAFCGHDPLCAEFNSERALAAAKENVERHYAVVGVIEEVNKTLEVMEALMPDVFAGVAFLTSGDFRANSPEFKLQAHSSCTTSTRRSGGSRTGTRSSCPWPRTSSRP